MSEPRGLRDLNRLRWVTIVLPIVFVWGFELVRFAVLDPNLTSDESHVAAAMVLGGAIVLFAMLVSVYLDRAQHQLVSQNRDLTVTHAVSSAVRGGLSLPDLLEQSLDRVVTETGALAGIVTVEGTDDRSLTIRRPATLTPGLAWLGPVLDEAMDPAVDAPRYTNRSGIDTGVLDLPLIRGAQRIGHIRLTFHPAVEPDISDAAFVDIAGEIAGAAQLGMTVADLHRREREREALHAVALQLTGRVELKDVLDTITQHARDLLGAERAVACLSDPRAAMTRIGIGAGGERLAMADDGSMCRVAHEKTAANHPQNPQCPLIARGTDTAWLARPLRGPEGVLGELCVARPGHPFSQSERDLLGALADMAAIAVRQARLHEAEEQWTIHAERDRIARELHDSLAQVLGVIHLQLRSLEARAKDEASLGIADELSALAETADEAYSDVREAILGLRETVREDDGLEGSLREYLRKYSRQTGIAASLTCEGDTRRALSPRAEVQLLRVVQEALTNARKHADATRVTVRIDCLDGGTTLTIEDDGVGFDLTSVIGSMEGGFGLASMRERVEQVGGTLDVHTAPTEGTRVVVRLEPEDTVGTHATEAPGAARR
jgi:signal transduction histidine kinase